jgi:hypothetical protein
MPLLPSVPPRTSSTRPLRLAVVTGMGALISACADGLTTPEPEFPTRSTTACVANGGGDAPPDTVPTLPGGGCPSGFDFISWW